MILGSEQNLRSAQQRGLETILKQRNLMQERTQRAREAQARLQELAANRVAAQQRAEAQEKAKVTAATTKFEREKELATLKADLKKKDIDPLDKRKKELDIQKLEQEIARGGITPSQEIAQKRLEIAERAEVRDIAADRAATMDFILDPDTADAQAKASAMIENARSTDVVFYENDGGYFGGAYMDMAQIPTGLTFNGKPATGADIIQRAAQANMTVPEFIEEIEKRRR